MRTIAERYQRASRFVIVVLTAAMLASIAWNDFTWVTMVCVWLLVAAILLGVLAHRLSLPPKRQAGPIRYEGASTPTETE